MGEWDEETQNLVPLSLEMVPVSHRQLFGFQIQETFTQWSHPLSTEFAPLRHFEKLYY